MNINIYPDSSTAFFLGNGIMLSAGQYTDGKQPELDVTYDNLELWNYTVPTVRYVDARSANPLAPYTSLANAATNIQQAVDLSVAGDILVVTNGVYPGGLIVTNALALQSINGPKATVIDGAGSRQCVFLGDGASLSGFTLTNGWGESGGGAWCTSAKASLINCSLTGNWAYDGGGVSGGTLYNCTLTGNKASFYGGGALSSTLYNCTLSGNSALGGTGGGAYLSTLYNSIVFYNGGASALNYDAGSTLNFCCTTPMPASGVGNITQPPLLVDWANDDLHLQPNSPCINAGKNAFVTTATDYNGNSRIASGTVDLGAYEYQAAGSIISYVWLQQFGLPTDGSADFTDADADGMNNWQEWVCGTSPTNSLSKLSLLSAKPQGANVTVTWQSVPGVSYFLQRSASLNSPFATLAVNLLGQPGTTTYTDTNAPTSGSLFYRVGVATP